VTVAALAWKTAGTTGAGGAGAVAVGAGAGWVGWAGGGLLVGLFVGLFVGLADALREGLAVTAELEAAGLEVAGLLDRAAELALVSGVRGADAGAATAGVAEVVAAAVGCPLVQPARRTLTRTPTRTPGMPVRAAPVGRARSARPCTAVIWSG
jgi:hypothetical protein